MSSNESAKRRDNQNIVVWRGDALRIRVPVARLDGAPVDVSGAENIIWSAAKNPSDTPVVTKEYVTGGVQLAGQDEFIVDLDSDDTALFTETVYWPEYSAATSNVIDRRSIDASYYHEARIIRDGGAPYTVISGRLFVRTSLIEDS